MITVNGRGVKKGKITWKAYPDGVCLRIDDEGKPEFWLEVCLGSEYLKAMLTEVDLAGVGALDELPLTEMELPELTLEPSIP